MTHPFHSAEPPNSSAIPLIKDIYGVSADFLGQLRTWFEQNPPSIPVTQIIGFNQFTVQSATSVITNDSTTSQTYVNLTNTGPTLTNLPDGQYVFVFGCIASNSTSGDGAVVSLSINGSTPDDNDGSQTQATVLTSVMRAVPKTLSGGGNNTVTMQYRVGVAGHTGHFAYRWLFGLRYANS